MAPLYILILARLRVRVSSRVLLVKEIRRRMQWTSVACVRMKGLNARMYLFQAQLIISLHSRWPASSPVRQRSLELHRLGLFISVPLSIAMAVPNLEVVRSCRQEGACDHCSTETFDRVSARNVCRGAEAVPILGCALGDHRSLCSESGGRHWYGLRPLLIASSSTRLGFYRWQSREPISKKEYMPDEAQRQEYVMQREGLIWKGSAQRSSAYY
jgi:hypothetical protein